MSITIVDRVALTTTYQPSKAFIPGANGIVLDMVIVVTTAITNVLWYFEFEKDENPAASATLWYQEMDEVDAGAGVVTQSKVVRKLQENGGAALAVGTHYLHFEFQRIGALARIQMAIPEAQGAVLATVYERNGGPANAPA